MQKFKNNKVIENKNELKKEQANSNIIAFRLSEQILIPILDQIANAANLSRTCAAQEILKDFLVKYNRKNKKDLEKAAKLNRPEPVPLDPFINSYSMKLQFAAYFRAKEAGKLLKELSQTDCEVASNE